MKRKIPVNLLLILIVVLIISISLFINTNSNFTGADGEGVELIESINPEYEPWFNNLWEPPGKEMETLLFSLQAAAGSAVLAFGLGYYMGRKGKSND